MIPSAIDLDRLCDCIARHGAGMWPPVPDAAQGVPAAVLIGLVEHARGATILFTYRPSHLTHHANQISLPGGRIEPDDAGPVACALRENHEEVGLPPSAVTVVGTLPDYVTRTGFHVVPVVGRLPAPLHLTPDPREVASVFEAPLDFFLDSRNHHRLSATIEGQRRSFWAMPYRQHYIWGVTAAILRSFHDLVNNRCFGSF